MRRPAIALLLTACAFLARLADLHRASRPIHPDRLREVFWTCASDALATAAQILSAQPLPHRPGR